MSENRSTKRHLTVAAVIIAGVVYAGLFITALAIVYSTRGGEQSVPAGPRFTASDHPVFARASAGQARTVSVHVGDYWFRLSTDRIPAGRITLTARNLGATVHDVMIERVPIKLSAPGVPVDMAAQGGFDGLQPGSARRTTVVLAPGRYAIFCSVPGHYQAGQHGELTVTTAA